MPADATQVVSDGDVGDLVAALTTAGVNDVDTSTRRRAEYSSDASLYRVPPMAVAFPRDADEVAAIIATGRQLGVAVTARGTGTSIAGNAVGPGIVVDVRRHLGRIHAIDPDARTAHVEPGVVLDDLQRAAEHHGLRFGPDPSTHDRCTLGGMIGNNACGSRAFGFGRTIDHVGALDVVAGTGQRIVVGTPRQIVDVDPVASQAAVNAALAVGQLHAATIDAEFGRFSRQASGFPLHYLREAHGPNVAKALVGTEGTCGLTVGAEISLVPIPTATMLVALGYPDMAVAADAVPRLLAEWTPDLAAANDPETVRITAIEGLDARIVDVVRRRRGSDAVPDMPAGGGWLFVEIAGPNTESLAGVARNVVSVSEAVDHRVIVDAGQTQALWRIREDGAGLIARASAEPAHAGWEDAAVPPERLGAYLRDFDGLLASHGLEGVPYGHFGDGCLHVRITFPLGKPGGRQVFRTFLDDAARLVAGYGGSMSGEHGDGRARGGLLAHMYSPAAIEAFADFKAVFDPDGIMNPGIIVRPRAVDDDLRLDVTRVIDAGLGFAYSESAGDFSAEVHRCTGVGRCVSDVGPGKVMCPSYAATGDEKDSTRGRARVLQEMANGSLVTDSWRSPEVHEALELCLACKGCASDCPTGVDMATYKAEVLHQRYRRRLRPRSHYTLGWLPRWARLAGIAPGLVAAMMAWAPVARLARWGAGVDQRRDLPVFASETFTEWFQRERGGEVGRDDLGQVDGSRGDADPGDADPGDAGVADRGLVDRRMADQAMDSGQGAGEVVLWPDTFTDRFAPHIGVAAVKVLEDAGYRVRLPSRSVCCGLTWISTGQLDAARRIVRRTVDALVDDARAGVPIVGLEPSCTAVLRADARELLGHDDDAAREVAAATRTLAEVLAARRPHWQMPDMTGVEIVAQPHCHHHAVMGWQTDRALLAAAGARVTQVGGCCGLAGNFGVEKGHHDVSLAVADTQLMPAVRAATDSAVVLADGFSCRTQLEHVSEHTSQHGQHLAEVLAAAIERRNRRDA